MRSLADELVRRMAALGDPALRIARLRALLPTLPAEALADALPEITRRAEQHDTAAQLTLLALAAVRAAPPPPSARRDPPVVEPEREAETGTPLPPLGVRKNLARRPERRLLERALRDEHPAVIAELLRNPQLTEADVVRLCAAPATSPEALALVFQAPRWQSRPRVRLAIARHPRAPVELATALVPLLGRDDLRELAADPRLPSAVRTLARARLGRRPPPDPEH
jgi:hypothetical protein